MEQRLVSRGARWSESERLPGPSPSDDGAHAPPPEPVSLWPIMTSMTDAAEVTETNPNRRSRREGSAGSSRGERPLRSALRRLEETLEHAGPIRVSDRTRVALQTGLAMVLAYGVALAMDWHRPYWAGLAVAGARPGRKRNR